MKITTFVSSLRLLLVAASLLLVGCDPNDMLHNLDGPEDADAWHTATLCLDAAKPAFDIPLTRSASEWEDGDEVYLLFTIEEGVAGGVATYQMDTHRWQVGYYGSLPREEELPLTAWYFEEPDFATSSEVTLAPTTGIYKSVEGTYYRPAEGDIQVHASLAPTTSRIRFKGTMGTTFTLGGIRYATTYDVSTGTLTESTSTTGSLIINTNGYSDYVYGVFADEKNPTWQVTTGGYTFVPLESPAEMFQVGQSGWTELPTLEGYNGWEKR